MCESVGVERRETAKRKNRRVRRENRAIVIRRRGLRGSEDTFLGRVANFEEGSFAARSLSAESLGVVRGGILW